MNRGRPDPEWLEKGVLIYGPRKAGTTLLLNLHDGGQDLFVYPSEIKLKRFIREPWSSPEEALERFLAHSTLPEAGLPNFDHDRYRDYVGGLDARDITDLLSLIRMQVRGVYESVVADRPSRPRAWVAKEVGGDPREIVGLWKNLSYDGRVIMIVRDPRMVTRSVILDRRRKGVKPSLIELFRQVLDPLRVIRGQSSMIGRPGLYFVTYEELTHDPAQTMEGICRFLEVQFDPVLCRPTIFGKGVVPKTSSRSTREVFRSNRVWHQGLSLKERLAVSLFSFLIGQVMRRTSGAAVSYEDLTRTIVSRRALDGDRGGIECSRPVAS